MSLPWFKRVRGQWVPYGRISIQLESEEDAKKLRQLYSRLEEHVNEKGLVWSVPEASPERLRAFCVQHGIRITYL